VECYSDGIRDEGKTVDNPKQLTVTMSFIIFTQLIKLRIPKFLVHLVLRKELETNFFELLNSFVIHYAIFEDSALRVDPSAQFRVFPVPSWNIA
jgi:hypothetical protein